MAPSCQLVKIVQFTVPVVYKSADDILLVDWMQWRIKIGVQVYLEPSLYVE
jgi:hypothetical protein